MKRNVLTLWFILMIVVTGFSQFYDFPFIGWQQTYTSYTWTGTQIQTGIFTLSFDRDTLIDGQSYISNGNTHFRSHDGEIFQIKYDWQTQSFHESLEYDFSLDIGDNIINETFALADSARVIHKERILNLVGDSIWQIDIQFQSNWITKDTITWIEGVGNLNKGLIKTNFPDGGFTHACTLLANNRKTFVNNNNTDYCNCRYKYGIDLDNDGYGNYTSRMAEVYLGFHFNNPSAEKSYKVRSCDTLKVISTDLDNIYFSALENCNGNFISIDSFSSSGINGEVLFTYFIYNIETYDKIYLSEECSWDFAEIYINPCFQNDCDDTNPNINPDQNEEPYNGIDDDCDSTTLDDDLDQDGFLLAEDCNDNNPNINPDQNEEPYNGIDDDCDSTTLDDDLDQDGFLLANDCDDANPNINPDQNEEPYNGIDDDCDSTTLDDDLDQDGFLLANDCDDDNANINPDAEEIADNGIDEDCDGNDLVSTTHEINNIKIQVYPNPVAEELFLDINGNLEYVVKLYNLNGKLIFSENNVQSIPTNSLSNGTYILKFQDLKSTNQFIENIIVAK